MRKIAYFLAGMIIVFGMGACSGSHDKMESKSDAGKKELMSQSEQKGFSTSDSSDEKNAESGTSQTEVRERKVIYTANLSVEASNYEKLLHSLEKKASTIGGYIVRSNSYHTDEENVAGEVVFRIPQERFQEFLDFSEGASAKVLERNVAGEDVTEEYVDLESRLKAKKTVEKRLLSFMENAQKTENLLKISDDLARVQEEIESIEGRRKYLENQSSLATITVSIRENKIKVGEIEKDQAGIWLKTKKEFIDSVNSLISVVSTLLIFILGNILYIIILVLISIPVIRYMKRKRGA
ncbi:DUF4349 domain-containing protein [Falsibacillus pallidus]|uniref:Uncharacterized protein DUF4349 n=1 Tax=Falsibacillus pallidus TaxID=493781 RepID=A0A370GWK4_9BACI|nr:DUF4349 domain-containing protein [Falsibacillus pallidus]RDI47630.1 uncharacterized protein DUF4349 [Falsibacillus pallidus]